MGMRSTTFEVTLTVDSMMYEDSPELHKRLLEEFLRDLAIDKDRQHAFGYGEDDTDVPYRFGDIFIRKVSIR